MPRSLGEEAAVRIEFEPSPAGLAAGLDAAVDPGGEPTAVKVTQFGERTRHRLITLTDAGAHRFPAFGAVELEVDDHVFFATGIVSVTEHICDHSTSPPCTWTSATRKPASALDRPLR